MKIVLFCISLTFALKNESCLTPAQDAQLKEATTIISNTLRTAEDALKIAAFFEKDPTTKNNLQLAARVIDVVNKEVVANLTKIADETCGTCTQIVAAVDDMVQEIEDALTQIEPDWQNNPLFVGIVDAIGAILEIVKAICPSQNSYVKSYNYPSKPYDSCLTPQQDEQLKQATKIIGNTLTATTDALKVAALLQKDPQTKQNLKLAAKIIETVNQEIIANLTKIADETCGTCSEIVSAVDDMVQEIEDTLTQIEPDWQNNPLFKGIVAAIKSILEIVKAICPGSFIDVKNMYSMFFGTNR